MPQFATPPPESQARALLSIAEYLSRPQHFVTVAEARMAFRHTLERAYEASVVLTTHGEPIAALISFTTLEALRGALLHLLVREMDTSFARVQTQVASEPHPESTSDAELEALVGEAVRRARSAPLPSDACTP